MYANIDSNLVNWGRGLTAPGFRTASRRSQIRLRL